jgi:hypothetical protein
MTKSIGFSLNFGATDMGDRIDLQTAPSDPIANFNNWLNTSVSGAKYTYHTGFLCKDRDPEIKFQGYKEVNEVANLAWKLYEKGVVTLTQRKLADNHYQYLAVKSARVNWG